ncbi:MAG: hypothetical protein GWP62_04050 [Gammaproteobacteria bacterium]|jgi:hypothetical protein|nr:hypothetical protein [Gammaproteobacteria bacterium]
MRTVILSSTVLVLAFFTPAISQAQDDDIDALRAAVAEMRADYDSRIAELERRLAVAEQNAAQASFSVQQSTIAAAPSTGAPSSASNPAIGVVFQGQARQTDASGSDEEEGYLLGETEVIMQANVDDKFRAWLTAAIALEDGESVIEIEESWVEATALPAGFGARFGRFASGIGYLNDKHSHQWDFADQPLPYQAFLDGRYFDGGLQMRWLAPTDLYMELGGEVLQGEGGGSGLESHSLFANVGGDVGINNSWLAGGSYLEIDDSTSVSVAHFLWKWAPQGNWRQKNFVFQTEYLERRDAVTDKGWYAQAVFQPFQRWRFGVRADELDLDVDSNDPSRWTLMMDWSNSEFSRFRLQVARDDDGTDTSNEWALQYIHSIGAHGAHDF